MTDLAPIVLFVFARPDHTRRTIEALRRNELAAESELIVYADGPRLPQHVQPVRDVRDLVRAVTGFRTVTLVERPENCGLANNIMDGVGEVCRRAGRVIVVEDDVVTSPQFLRFMNAALARYVDEPRVHHISGWNYPIDPAGLGDAFLWRVMNCWGWATWADRWQHFSRDPDRLVQTWSDAKIRRFNLDGAHDFWLQVVANQQGKLRTWATFWYATILERDGLCVNPARTLVQNIGQDGSGEHFADNVLFWGELGGQTEYAWPSQMLEARIAVARVQEFYRRMSPPLPLRVLGQLKRYVERRLQALWRTR